MQTVEVISVSLWFILPQRRKRIYCVNMRMLEKENGDISSKSFI